MTHPHDPDFCVDPVHDGEAALGERNALADANAELFAENRGLRETVRWFIGNRSWWERVMSGAYRGERLGLAPE